MKFLKHLLIILLALSLIFFFACGEEQEPEPEKVKEGAEQIPEKVVEDKIPEEIEEVAIEEIEPEIEPEVVTEVEPEVIEVTFLTGGSVEEKALDKQLIDNFNATNPDIKVEFIESPMDTESRLQQIVNALKGAQTDPDIFTMDVAWIGQIAASGWLADLAPYQIDTSDFYESIIKGTDTYRGKLIALPHFIDAGLLLYRTDLLEKYGYSEAPKTWEELVEIAQVVQEGERSAGNADFWGYVWQGAQYEGLVCNCLETFVSAGGGFVDKNGTPIYDDESNVKAITFMKDLIHTYKISPPDTFSSQKEEESRAIWNIGNAMFHRNWPYAVGLSINSDTSQVKGKFATSPLPYFDGTNGKSAATLGGWHIGMSESSDVKEAAARFLEYYTSYEVQKERTLELSQNPPRPALYDNVDILAKLPHLSMLRDLFVGAVPRPRVPYYNRMTEIMQKYFNAVLVGDMPADEALKNAQTEIEEVREEFE